MGGRMCSMAASEGLPTSCLVLISYPLHPPGRPDRLRTEHFPTITVPCLFVSGDRDPFGSPDELEEATAAIPGRTPSGCPAATTGCVGETPRSRRSSNRGSPPPEQRSVTDACKSAHRRERATVVPTHLAGRTMAVTAQLEFSEEELLADIEVSEPLRGWGAMPRWLPRRRDLRIPADAVSGSGDRGVATAAR